jgi:hypothetical protein
MKSKMAPLCVSLKPVMVDGCFAENRMNSADIGDDA